MNGNQLRTLSKVVLSAVLMTAGAVGLNAQNTVINVVQDLNFKLTGYYQLSGTENATTFFRHAAKITITNKDIINLLEPEVGFIFSGDAKLLLIGAVATNLPPKVIVRDRFEGERFDTDVSQYFSAEILASIEDTKINKNPLKASGISYDSLAFEMHTSKADFRVQGFGQVSVKTGKHEGEPVAIVHTGKVDVSGAGEYQVSILGGVVPVALEGSVQISGTDVQAMEE